MARLWLTLGWSNVHRGARPMRARSNKHMGSWDCRAGVRELTGSGSLIAGGGALSRPVGGSDAGEALGLGLDHSLEGAGAQGALLLQGCSDSREVFRGQRGVEQGAVGVGAGGGVRAKREEAGMGLQRGVGPQAQVGQAA